MGYEVLSAASCTATTEFSVLRVCVPTTKRSEKGTAKRILAHTARPGQNRHSGRAWRAHLYRTTLSAQSAPGVYPERRKLRMLDYSLFPTGVFDVVTCVLCHNSFKNNKLLSKQIALL